MNNKETVSKFTPNDLKPGDFVKLRSGAEYCIISDFRVCINQRGDCVTWKDLNNDLRDPTCPKDDIMQVRRPTCVDNCNFAIFEVNAGQLLFNREEEEVEMTEVEMTLEEVCKELGKNIKIIKK